MSERIQKLLDRIESRIARWKVLTGGGVVVSSAGISGGIAAWTDWLNAYGPIAWWFAALLGALLALLIGLAFVWLRYIWIKAEAVRKWKQQVDSCNPLDNEFTKRRLKLHDIEHPVSHKISGKRFIDCELVGPANILLYKVEITNVRFLNCDIVVVRPSTLAVRNMIIMGGC